MRTSERPDKGTAAGDGCVQFLRSRLCFMMDALAEHQSHPILSELSGWSHATPSSGSVKAYVVGGFIRDAIIAQPPKSGTGTDIDIVVAGRSGTMVMSQLRERYPATENRHGGYRFEIPGKSAVDVWLLERSPRLIRTRKPRSIRSLLDTFDLSINAVGFDLLSKRLILPCRTAQSIMSRTIDIPGVAFENALDRSDCEIIAARAVLYSDRLEFSLSRSAQSFVRRYYSPEILAQCLAKKHLGAQFVRLNSLYSGSFERTSINLIVRPRRNSPGPRATRTNTHILPACCADSEQPHFER